ncbi:MAG: plastocyanin/azurin family copper-binding protein [Haloplanus sp.]
MKALGAGTVLSALGGTATAQQGNGTDTPDRDRTRDRTRTVHQVQTVIQGPPTNPERPADFFYQPTGIAIQPGDVLQFVFETPDHNVVSYHPAFGMQRRMPTGVGPFSAPIHGWRPDSIPGDQIDPPAETGDGTSGTDGPIPDSWFHAFETPGVYDLLCSPHETFGMAMRVVVGDVTEAPFETADAAALPDPRAGPVGLARATLTDPALAPSNVLDAGQVTWESLAANQAPETGTETGTGTATGTGTGTGTQS